VFSTSGDTSASEQTIACPRLTSKKPQGIPFVATDAATSSESLDAPSNAGRSADTWEAEHRSS
jgi:hypothetical protein